MNKREMRKQCKPFLYQDVAVRGIIEKELTDREWVSEYHVIQMLKDRIHAPLLYNAAIAAGVDTDDADTNVQAGAKQVLEHTLPRLTGYRRDGTKIFRQ